MSVNSMRFLLALGAACFLGGVPALAQSPASPPSGTPQPLMTNADSGWSVTGMPYLWLAGVTGTVTTRFGTSTTTANFGDILSNLSAIPIMGAVEARYNRFAVLEDIMIMAIKTDISTKGVLFGGGTGKIFNVVSTTLGTYRVLETPQQALEIGAGVRAYGMSVTLDLKSGLLPGGSHSVWGAWADPLLAVRYRANLGGNFGASFHADFGGFGAGSKYTYQLVGALSYAVSDSTEISLGYRHLAFDYKPGSGPLELNNAMSGPFLGARMRF